MLSVITGLTIMAIIVAIPLALWCRISHKASRFLEPIHERNKPWLFTLLLGCALAFPALAQAQTPPIVQTKLAWDKPLPPQPPLVPAPITGYKMYRLEPPMTTWNLVGTIVGENTLTYTDATTVAGKAYSFRVTAYNSTQESPPSNIVNHTPESPLSPPQNARVVITIIIQ